MALSEDPSDCLRFPGSFDFEEYLANDDQIYIDDVGGLPGSNRNTKKANHQVNHSSIDQDDKISSVEIDPLGHDGSLSSAGRPIGVQPQSPRSTVSS